MMDSVPVVFITGQVRTELLGTDGFQEADTIGITMPIVKHSFMIQHPLEIPRAIHEAFHIARSGRPGPVLVDIPQDLSRAEIEYEPVTDVRLPGYQPTLEGNQKQIRQAAKALAAAQRPVIYAGGGVVNANASEELVEFATCDRFPVTTHADGPRRLSRPPARRQGGRPGGWTAPAVAGDARDARHARRQLRDGRGRPDLRGGRALRRPHHRQALGVRAAREVHPHRRRPRGDIQERARAHPDRRRRQARAREAARWSTARSAPTPRVWSSGGRASRAGARSTRWATRTAPTPRSSRST